MNWWVAALRASLADAYRRGDVAKVKRLTKILLEATTRH
jgi:hypothetical protein